MEEFLLIKCALVEDAGSAPSQLDGLQSITSLYKLQSVHFQNGNRPPPLINGDDVVGGASSTLQALCK